MKLIHLFLFFAISFAASSNGYAPMQAYCPSNSSMIRNGNKISPKESAWLGHRHKKTDSAIRVYLKRTGHTVDARIFHKDNTKSINIGIAFSGGGLRAMFSGAGQIAALDNRTSAANEQGLGGVLQASSYIAGLSGGSWFLSSLTFQGWPTIDEVVFKNPHNLWDYASLSTFVNTSKPLGILYSFASTNYEKILDRLPWWNMPSGKGIGDDLKRKRDAGFYVSVTDAWGRLLAHSLFRKGNDNWQNSATWSGIRDLDLFKNHEMPFPIITALARSPDSLDYNLNSPIVEFNPFEMGSFGTSIKAFHDIKYLGTPVANGVPMGACMTGFDNAAFVMGTSSSLFNQFLNTLACPSCNSINSVLKYFLRKLLQLMSKTRQDIAWFKPNPFMASTFGKSKKLSSSDTLYLMDGGLAGEIVPLSTIAVKEREMDLIFSFDNDGPKWPDGSSLINTYKRQLLYEGSSIVCPYVPGQSTFTHNNLTAKPTFFGCDAKNLTALEKDGVVPPIIIYIANRPYEFYSNTSTLKLTYTDNEKKGMITNGFDIASRGNHTASPDWRFCVGCAMVRRSEERLDIEQSEKCKKCFEYYCWDGEIYENSSHVPPQNFAATGLTDQPTILDTRNSYIHKKKTLLSFVKRVISLFDMKYLLGRVFDSIFGG